MGTAVYRTISNNPDAESTYSGNPKKPKSEGICSEVKLYTGITPASWIDGVDSASQPNHDEDRIVSNELAGPASSVDIESPSPNAEWEVENEETPRRRRPKRTAGRPRHLVDYV